MVLWMPSCLGYMLSKMVGYFFIAVDLLLTCTCTAYVWRIFNHTHQFNITMPMACGLFLGVQYYIEYSVIHSFTLFIDLFGKLTNNGKAWCRVLSKHTTVYFCMAGNTPYRYNILAHLIAYTQLHTLSISSL